MWYVLSFVSGCILSSAVLLTVAWRLRDRLTRRLEAARRLAETARDLENRRVAYDSGRDTLARSNGGRPARIVDGLGTKPGILAQYLRDK